MNYEKIDSLVDSMKDELIADMRRWLSVPSVLGPAAENAPFGVENRRMLDMALADAKKYGFAVKDYDGYAGEISLGSGEQTMGMLCHLDVVPAGDGWTYDPWGATIVDGKMYARGAMDDKGPALCALYAMRAVKEAGVPLKDGVRLILGCDEETGMRDMRYYASKTKMPDYGFSPDAEFPVINIEKGGIGFSISSYTGGEGEGDMAVTSLYAGERANVVPGVATATLTVKDVEAFKAAVAKVAAEKNFKLTVEEVIPEEVELTAEEAANLDRMISDLEKIDGVEVDMEEDDLTVVTLTAEGVSAHASMPHLGVNAAGMLLIALKELGAGLGSKAAIAALADKLGLEYDGASIGIKQADEESGALTCNLGILRYDGANITARLDIRYPICADPKDMCGSVSVSLIGTPLVAACTGYRGPHHVPKEHKVVRGLLEVYHDVTGLPAYAFAIGGGTYSRCMPNTVAFGLNFPGDTDTCHMPDEYIDLEKLMLSVKIFAHAIVKLAGEDE